MLSGNILRNWNHELDQTLDSIDFDGQEIVHESFDAFDAFDYLKKVLNVTAPKTKTRWLDHPVDAKLIEEGTIQSIGSNHYRYTTRKKLEPKTKLIDLNHKCYSVAIREHPEWLIKCLYVFIDKGLTANVASVADNFIHDIKLQFVEIEGKKMDIFGSVIISPPPKN